MSTLLNLQPAKYASVTARAGLGVIELAAVFGVSRQTVHRWNSGRFPNAPVSIVAMNRVLAALARAIEHKLLPFPADLSKEKRSQRIQAMRASLLR